MFVVEHGAEEARLGEEVQYGGVEHSGDIHLVQKFVECRVLVLATGQQIVYDRIVCRLNIHKHYLKMLLLITEFGLSCYMAAKVLDLPYTNAKVIYRVFREERRIVQNSRNPTGAQQFFEG